MRNEFYTADGAFRVVVEEQTKPIYCASSCFYVAIWSFDRDGAQSLFDYFERPSRLAAIRLAKRFCRAQAYEPQRFVEA